MKRLPHFATAKEVANQRTQARMSAFTACAHVHVRTSYAQYEAQGGSVCVWSFALGCALLHAHVVRDCECNASLYNCKTTVREG